MPKRVATKVMMDDEMWKRLQQDADKFGHRSPNAIIEEILTQYLPFWEQAEEVRQEALQRQFEVLNPKSPAPPARKKTG